MDNLTPLAMPILIVEAGTPATPLSPYREDCSIQALCRGLAMYLMQLSTQDPNGKTLRFVAAYDTTPTTEELVHFPAVAVFQEGDATYSPTSMAGSGGFGDVLPAPDGRRVTNPADVEAWLRVYIWATDTQQRSSLLAMVEDALLPTDLGWEAKLELPFYHNARATYAMTALSLVEDGDQAMKRERQASIRVRGTIPLIRVLAPAAPFHPRLVTTVG